MEHLALFPAGFAPQAGADGLTGLPGGGELVVERSQHGGHLLQAVPVLTAGGQPGQQLYVLEVVETVEDRPQQQLGKVELDGFSEALTRRLQLVSNLGLGKKRVEAVPVTKRQLYNLFLAEHLTSAPGSTHPEHTSRKPRTPPPLPAPRSKTRWR